MGVRGRVICREFLSPLLQRPFLVGPHGDNPGGERKDLSGDVGARGSGGARAWVEGGALPGQTRGHSPGGALRRGRSGAVVAGKSQEVQCLPA